MCQPFEHYHAVGVTENMARAIVHMPRISNSKPEIRRNYKKRGIVGFVLIISISALICLLINKPKALLSFCGVEKMYNDSFYIELSSNATSYKNNTVANFKNDITLLRPLEGNWSVGLVEISYTKSWKNLQKDFKVCLASERNISSSYVELFSAAVYEDEDGRFRCGTLRAGHYADIQMLINELNNEIKAIKDSKIVNLPQLYYNSITKHVHLMAGLDKDNVNLLLKLGKEIKDILGFTSYSSVNPTYKSDNGSPYIVSDRPADIDASLHTLYVYCDIIEPQYIGDTRARLLKTVEVPPNTKFGEQVVIKYENPHYLPLIINDFEHIEIDIKTDTNTRMPFLYGRSRIKLHLKKRND
jgi:hypothetical protein